MKKFLLSCLSIVAMGFAANAAEVTINVNDYTDIQGSLVEEELKDDGSVKAAKHVQPLESIEFEGGWTIAPAQGDASTAPAYYWPTSTSTKTQNTVRVYKGNSVTFTAPEGAFISKVEFTGKGATVLYNGEAKASVEVAISASLQFETLIITYAGEAGETPDPVDPVDPNPDTGDEPVASDQVTVNVNEYDEISGELVEETFKEDGTTVQAAKHVQPLESIVLGGFEIIPVQGDSKTAPAYYWPTSTSGKTQNTIRVYSGNTVTFNAPAGKYIAKVEFTGKGATVLYNGPAKASVTAAITASLQFETITFTVADKEGEGAGDDPVTPDPGQPTDGHIYTGLTTSADGWTLDNGTLPEGLSFVWQWNTSYNYLKASAYYKQAYASDAYAYTTINLADATGCKATFEHAANYLDGAAASDVFQVVAREAGAAQWTVVPVSVWPAGTDWTFVEATADLSAFDGKKIEFGFHHTSTANAAGTWEMKNVVVDGEKAGVAAVEADLDAPAVYFDLQGRRVANPQGGIFIRRQGNVVTKVVLR